MGREKGCIQLNKVQDEKLIEQIKDGIHWRELIKRFKVSRSTIYRIMEREKIKVETKRTIDYAHVFTQAINDNFIYNSF